MFYVHKKLQKPKTCVGKQTLKIINARIIVTIRVRTYILLITSDLDKQNPLIFYFCYTIPNILPSYRYVTKKKCLQITNSV